MTSDWHWRDQSSDFIDHHEYTLASTVRVWRREVIWFSLHFERILWLPCKIVCGRGWKQGAQVGGSCGIQTRDVDNGIEMGREVIIFGIWSESQRICWPVEQGYKKQRDYKWRINWKDRWSCHLVEGERGKLAGGKVSRSLLLCYCVVWWHVVWQQCIRHLGGGVSWGVDYRSLEWSVEVWVGTKSEAWKHVVGNIL